MCTYLPERRGGAYTGDAVREWLCGLLLLQLTFADSIRNLLVRRGGPLEEEEEGARVCMYWM